MKQCCLKRCRHWGSTPLCSSDIRNNTRYHEEERTSNGHFIHGAFQKMAAENASNFTKSSNLHKTQAEKSIFPPKFLKVTIGKSKGSQIFRIFTVCILYCTMYISMPYLCSMYACAVLVYTHVRTACQYLYCFVQCLVSVYVLYCTLSGDCKYLRVCTALYVCPSFSPILSPSSHLSPHFSPLPVCFQSSPHLSPSHPPLSPSPCLSFSRFKLCLLKELATTATLPQSLWSPSHWPMLVLLSRVP